MKYFRNVFIFLVVCFGRVNKCNSQDSIKIDGVYISKNNKNVKLIIKNKRFAYIDLSKNFDLASPCCDTITYGYVKLNSDGYLEFESDSSLNPIFVGMEVTEKIKRGPDSVFFLITNPIENQFKKFNSKGGNLIYSLLVDPKSNNSGYFKENNQSFEGGVIKYYNPARLSIGSFTITIEPKNSMYVKNIAVRGLSTVTYRVKNEKANVFEIDMPQLNYGYISYKRIAGSFAKFIDQKKIVWEGQEFLKFVE